ncbi:MAG: helix-turn-helix domain-containing protein [Oscillospiraceae bacterium]|nr:helix-turn-helix domain-containing protein [Oscillospiraceae bacterium]
MNELLNTFGQTIKGARKVAGLTQEALAEKAGVTTRYIMAIENENKHPSMKVLYKLIRSLQISADTIFYPESKAINSKVEKLVRLINQCDEREIEVISATVDALLERK